MLEQFDLSDYEKQVLEKYLAKENNLNYLEFFSMKEFRNWFDNLN